MVKKGVARIKDEYSYMVFTQFTNEGIIYNQFTLGVESQKPRYFFATAVASLLKKIPLPIALNGFTASRLLPHTGC